MHRADTNAKTIDRSCRTLTAEPLTDRAGNRAAVQTQPGEPVLGFPPGTMQVASVPTGFFTGRVPLTAIRLALRDFAGVDLANIGEIALPFDQRPSGSLFVGDLEWVR